MAGVDLSSAASTTARPVTRRDGESMEKGKELLKFKKQKLVCLQRDIRLTPECRIEGGGCDAFLTLSLTVSPYSQHHTETYFQEHVFCFLF